MNRVMHLQVVYRGPSVGALGAVRSVADALGVGISDARWFGNQLLTAELDMLVEHSGWLGDALTQGGLEVAEAEFRVACDAVARLPSDDDLLCRLAVHCVHDEPDKRRVVPAVPS